jgi:hypothetical protein
MNHGQTTRALIEAIADAIEASDLSFPAVMTALQTNVAALIAAKVQGNQQIAGATCDFFHEQLSKQTHRMTEQAREILNQENDHG